MISNVLVGESTDIEKASFYKKPICMLLLLF